MFNRSIKINENNSFFLFGPRGVGKTHLVKERILADHRLVIDLLDPIELEMFSMDPHELIRRMDGAGALLEWVIIDEVQKIPKLLDLVHKLIEERPIKFALTGSSARKLKRGGADMLAGRAFTYHLHPLTSFELGGGHDLREILRFGTLPRIFQLTTAEEKKLYLQSYVSTYIKEEIQVEQIVRRLDPFRRFLQVAAQSNGEVISYSNIARDVASTDKSVRSYFEILEDTLLGFLLEPYHASIRKRQTTSPKFYFFDVGVQRALARTVSLEILPKTAEFGRSFEHLVILEMIRNSSYLRNDFAFSYLRTKDGAEIDLVVERPGAPVALIEIKSADGVRDDHVRTLNRLATDFENAQAYCLSLDVSPKQIGNVRCLFWQEGVREILGGVAVF